MRPSHPLGSVLARMALQKEGRRTGPCVKIYCIYCSGRFCGTIRNLTPQGGTLCLTGVGWTGAFLRCILTGSWCPRAKTRLGPVCRISNPVHGFWKKVSLQPNGGPRWFSPPEGFYGVIAAQAGIQNFKAFDKTGLLPRAGMARGAIRLKCYGKRYIDPTRRVMVIHLDSVRSIVRFPSR